MHDRIKELKEISYPADANVMQKNSVKENIYIIL